MKQVNHAAPTAVHCEGGRAAASGHTAWLQKHHQAAAVLRRRGTSLKPSAPRAGMGLLDAWFSPETSLGSMWFEVIEESLVSQAII